MEMSSALRRGSCQALSPTLTELLAHKRKQMPSECSPGSTSSKALLSLTLFFAFFEGAFPGALALARAGLAERTMAGGFLALGASGHSCRNICLIKSAVCKQ